MIDWAAIAMKGAALVPGQARKWWNRDASRNLDRAVRRSIDGDTRYTAAVREELVVQWSSVRDDEILTQLLGSLLIEAQPELEPFVQTRIAELLDDLDLALGGTETAQVLSNKLLSNLGSAQQDPQAGNRADHQRTQAHVGALRDDLHAVGRQLDELTARSGEATAQVQLILPGDLADHQQRVLARLRADDPARAGQLAALLHAQGVDALDSLVRVPPVWAGAAPSAFWVAVHRLAVAEGRWQTALRAAQCEAENPAADRAAALVRAARASHYGGDNEPASASIEKAAEIDERHPALLLFRAELARTHTERLAWAEKALPIDDEQRAAQKAQIAFALLGQGLIEDGQAAAEESVRLDPHGGGREALHLGVIMAATEEFPNVQQDLDALHAAADWCLELADESRRRGREAMVDVATSRAALALALAGIPERARPLIEGALARVQDLETEAAWNYGLAAHYCDDSALALRVLPSGGDEYMRVQRAMIAALGGTGVAEALPELDELARSADLQISRAAAVARIRAASDPTISLPEDLVALVPDGELLLTHVKAMRAAAGGDLAEAQRLVTGLDDTDSLLLRTDFAIQAGDDERALGVARHLARVDPSPLHRLGLAERLRAVGQLAPARTEALGVASDDRALPAVRVEAFGFAAQIAAKEGDFAGLEAIATACSRVAPEADDPVWWQALALARRRRHVDAFALVSARSPRVRDEQQAELLADIFVNGITEPEERLSRLAALSDDRGRPERFEHVLIRAARALPPGTITDPGLITRLNTMELEFGQRFPDSQLVQLVVADPADPLRSLREALDRVNPNRAEQAGLAAEAMQGVRIGTTPIAALASLLGRSTATVLADSPALPLGFVDDAEREHDRDAAEQALGRSAASWDSVAIAVVSALPGDASRRLRALLVGSVVGQTVLDEAPHNFSLDGLAPKGSAGAFAATLAVTPDAPAANVLEPGLTAVLADREVPLAFRALVSAWNVAAIERLPVYSDDRVARKMTRELGLQAFGTLALLDVAEQRGDWAPEDATTVRDSLVQRGAWGIANSPGDLVTAARRTGFAWDAGLTAAFSDIHAHRQAPRGLTEHAAALLLVVAAEASDQLDDRCEHVVAAFDAALEHDRNRIVRFILGRIIFFEPAPDADHDARARVVRALREVRGVARGTGQGDPLVALVNEYLASAPTVESRAAALRDVLRQVDAEDEALLRRTFAREP
ncbi:hypothetical protein OJ998_05000 [Solirubrobacter taibaiensis]|nr:hypothetical protein [Solirubrobacter taibaiensis]